MIKHALRKSLRSTRLPYSRHALLQSNVASLVLLTALLLYSNWCYQSLKTRVHAERMARQTSFRAPVPAVVAGLVFSWGLDADYRLGRTGSDLASPGVILARLEVTHVAASRHSLLVTSSGAVWSMGANDSRGGGGHGSKALAASGQLGRPGSWAPGQVLGALQRQIVKQVAAGRYHSVAVTADGKVYTWGLNDWGQLGRPATTAGGEAGAVDSSADSSQKAAALQKDERLPRRRRALLADGGPADSSVPAADAAAAIQAAQTASSANSTKAHTIADAGPTTSGDKPASGSSSRIAACYSGWSCHDGTPGLVHVLSNTTIVAAQAGRYSTLVLDAAGQLWAWGYDGCAGAGQLPLQGEAWKPRLVQGQLQDKRVTVFDVGYTFWLAATANGTLYTCDTQDDGYAGTLPEKRKPNHAGQLGRTGPPHEPGHVRGALEGKSVVAVAAGREHALVATADGQVFSFGGGRAVLGRAGAAAQPALVTGPLAGQVVQHVAAGEYYSLAATSSTVYGWGSNSYLGTGTGTNKSAEVLQPTAVMGSLGSGEWTIHALTAGYQHTLAIADSPTSAAAAKLRADALAAAAADGSGPQQRAVEVVLTEQQKRQRKEYQEAQHDVIIHPVLLPQQQQDSTVGVQQGPAQSAMAGQQQTVDTGASAAPPAANSAGTGAGSPAGDYHWSYLAGQPGPGALRPHEVWCAWKPSPWHDGLAALSPDVFKLLPQQYNKIHTNPCWGGSGPQLACLPYFNIIGVSKCGTTDLYHRLSLYKQVVLPATNKGPHFWDECPFPANGACQAGPTGDFQAYINLFNRAADLIRTRPDAITGEASSNTFTSANSIYLRGFRGDQSMEQWAGASGINATMPALLREAQPYLRLILMLRNPVTRYYSAYHYYRWWMKDAQAPTPNDFHETARKDVEQWKECVAAHSVPECVRSYKPQQLVKGMYAQFLPDWLRHWPKEQLLILRYEDYTAALPQHLKAVLSFLHVPEPDAATMQTMVAAEVQNKKPYPPMRADTNQLLESFYAPFNAALAELLADERWKWAF